MTQTPAAPSPSSPAERVPVGVDASRASIARVYDAFLNGKDNYEIDRQVLAQVEAHMPSARELGVENRAFLIRVCRFLATQTDIDQFLDLGSGLPTAENVHQVVQRMRPEAQIVYVDNDPVVLAHGRAMLEENENCRFVAADIFETKNILGNEEIRSVIDFNRPLALMQMGTLHHYNGPREAPKDIMPPRRPSCTARWARAPSAPTPSSRSSSRDWSSSTPAWCAAPTGGRTGRG
jgi:hypothetical protein